MGQEDAEVNDQVFPEFYLEDKVKLYGESIDPLLHVYKRRGKSGIKEGKKGGHVGQINDEKQNE
jgi:hypothetical protein